jgi:hypothetical protein
MDQDDALNGPRRVIFRLQFESEYDAIPVALIDGQPQTVRPVDVDPWTCETPCYRIEDSQLVITLSGRHLELRP